MCWKFRQFDENFIKRRRALLSRNFFEKKNQMQDLRKLGLFRQFDENFIKTRRALLSRNFLKNSIVTYNSVIFSLYLWSDNALFYVQFMKKIIKQFSSHEIFLWFFRKDFCPMGKSLASLNFSHSLFSKFIKKYYCTIIGLWGCTALGTIFLPADFAIPCPVSIVLITSLSLILGM